MIVMQKIVINVEWCGSNYSGGFGNPDLGVCVATGDTWEEFKQEFAEAMDFHLEGMEEHGDLLPQWAVDRDYEIEYKMATSALLHRALKYTTLEAISRASGLRRSALKSYATGDVCPREAQCEKMLQALKKISADLQELADNMK